MQQPFGAAPLQACVADLFAALAPAAARTPAAPTPAAPAPAAGSPPPELDETTEHLFFLSGSLDTDSQRLLLRPWGLDASKPASPAAGAAAPSPAAALPAALPLPASHGLVWPSQQQQQQRAGVRRQAETSARQPAPKRRCADASATSAGRRHALRGVAQPAPAAQQPAAQPVQQSKRWAVDLLPVGGPLPLQASLRGPLEPPPQLQLAPQPPAAWQAWQPAAACPAESSGSVNAPLRSRQDEEVEQQLRSVERDALSAMAELARCPLSRARMVDPVVAADG